MKLYSVREVSVTRVRIGAASPVQSLGALLLLCLGVSACGDEATIISVPAEVPAGPGGPDSADEPVYAFQSVVFGPDDSTSSYVALTHSNDISGVTLEGAREFPGYAFITVVDGKLLVSSGEEPIVTRYDITPSLGWSEVDRMGFDNYGITGGGAGFERHWFLDQSTAYVTLDVTKRVIWNPTTMTIEGVAEDSALELNRDGLVLDASFNRQPRILGGPILKPFYYRDDQWYRFGPSTPIAVYDSATHREQAIIDVPCPALEVQSRDEAGNTYFSPWSYGPESGLFGEGPEVCIRRITPENRLDESWGGELTRWTGGRPVMVFRYMGGGKAIGTVLHTDEADVDYASGYTDEAALELAGKYRLWLFDLDNQSAQQISGVERIDSGFFWGNIDGRTFVFAPYEDWSRSKVYELFPDGSVTEVLDTLGYAYELLRVR